MRITINIYYSSNEPGNAAAFAEEMEQRVYPKMTSRQCGTCGGYDDYLK